MRAKGQRGFTLIEVIVVAGIIAILAGILVPMIFKEIDESRITRASADVRSISTAIFIFKKDTGKWPALSDDCSTAVTLLEGSGNDPVNNIAFIGFNKSVTVSLDSYLQSDIGCYSNWKGPYMAAVTADPWGVKYFINADGFDKDRMVWILSAGPNRTMETNPSGRNLGGDDVGIVLQAGNPIE